MRKILKLTGMFALGGLLAVVFAFTFVYLKGLQEIDTPLVFPLRFGDTSIVMAPSDEIGDIVCFISGEALLTLNFDRQNKMQLNHISMSNSGNLFVSYDIQFKDNVMRSTYCGEKKNHADLNTDGNFDYICFFTESDSPEFIYYNSDWILVDRSEKNSYRFDIEKGWVKK